MHPRELVNHIRSGPIELVFDTPLRFLPRTCSNPYDFNEFLQALQSSDTIQDVICSSQQTLGITEEEWVLLVKTLGRIRDLQKLKFWCRVGSLEFRPLQAVADAVNNARSLRELVIRIRGQTFSRDPSGLTALANALREHTALQEFRWIDFGSRSQVAPVDISLDPVLRALPACPHLRKVTIRTTCASADATRTLLQLPEDAVLALSVDMEHWLAVADGIGQGHCNIKSLSLLLLQSFQSSRSKDTEAVKAIASAIRLDRNLEHLELQMNNDFTDEAGMAMAEALTINTTLRNITLSADIYYVGNDPAFGATVYEAYSAMLRVNTSLVLEFPLFDDACGDERLVDSRNQMRIEQSLNHVGRGRLLSSSQTPREEWVNALNHMNELNSSSDVDETPEFNVSCLYSLLRLNPATCM
jgi:hypothetical protein